ncbi:MAG: ssDNA-binding protein [bacterium]
MKIQLTNVRLAFNDLFKPVPFKDGEPTYNATFLIAKGSELHKKVEAAAIAALNAKFPSKGEAIRKQIEGNTNKCCIQDGDKQSYDGFEGNIAVRAKARVNQRPVVIDRDKSPLTQADGRIYSGCYVNASIEFFGYDNTGKGLSAQLRGVQFLRDGDSFGGGSPASSDEFESVEEGATADDLV